MTSPTPKPRAGEHTLTYSAKWADQEVDKIIDERDLLRERERELSAIVTRVDELSEAFDLREDKGRRALANEINHLGREARALLAKHGR